MSKNIRESVKELSKSKDVKELLPNYVKQSMELFHGYSRLKLMMEYYVFYEMIWEGINPYIESGKEVAEGIHKVIKNTISKEVSQEQLEESKKILLQLREEVTEKMKVLTAYVDCFVIYEYILNRIQYSFEDQEMVSEDVVFTKEILDFIFSTHDNVVVNDHIRSVLGQLPMRMTRTKYFDLIKDSISVYQGSDKSSLEGFLYMFRTSSMLYHTESMDTCFTEFKPILEELSQLDYSEMDEATYKIYVEKISNNASKLSDISDLYMLMQQLINETYSMVLTFEYGKNVENMEAANVVIEGINDLFLEGDSLIWGQNQFMSSEEKLSWLGEYFTEIEGQQESLYEGLNMVQAVLHETKDSHKETIAELGLTQAFEDLCDLEQLCSNSPFAQLGEGVSEEVLTQKDIEQAAATLILELKELFIKSNGKVRRAIMANTLEKMPVFFTSSQEVADYISFSFAQCEDEAEKYASKQLIQSLME